MWRTNKTLSIYYQIHAGYFFVLLTGILHIYFDNVALIKYVRPF